ncbi:MAG TPA: serine/threonine-protein kinase, partial [Gemmatimonadales bacterium]|nr:serine/threonine-protein kinase [Gemmatimonadales bacterium]
MRHYPRPPPLVTGISTALAAALRDRYAIERPLGRGGMATVYLATDLRHGRSVALKVLRADLAATLGPDRFRREIQTAARLQHPHICTVYDSGESDGVLWFTMPFVRGESLRERLARGGRLPLDEAVRITTQAG